MTSQPVFHLLTVCGPERAADGTLDILFRSLVAQADVKTQIWLVAQGFSDATLARIISEYKDLSIEVRRVAGVRPAAHSRNLALSDMLDAAAPQDIIAFPDDDCWYAPNTLACVSHAMSAGADYLIAALAPQSAAENVETLRFARLEDSLYRACTSTIFLRGAAARQIGLFDERFGLGAPFGSAEDTDYITRAWRMGLSGSVAPSIVVGHPVKPFRPAQYYRGNLALLAKHIQADQLMPRRFLLRLARGLKYVMSGAISLSSYLSSCIAALRLLMDIKMAR